MKFRLIYKPSTMGSGPLFNSIQEKIIAFRQEEQNLWSITFRNSQTFDVNLLPNNGARSVDAFLLGDQNKTGT